MCTQFNTNLFLHNNIVKYIIQRKWIMNVVTCHRRLYIHNIYIFLAIVLAFHTCIHNIGMHHQIKYIMWYVRHIVHK